MNKQCFLIFFLLFNQLHAAQLGFSSLHNELLNMPLSVEGKIPEWLHGTFATIGPAIFELNDSVARHWLDGFAMIHTFNINKGQVIYSNKKINSFYYKDCCRLGKLRGSVPPKKSALSKLTSALLSNKRPRYDNTNMNIVCFNNQLVALTEAPIALKINHKTLKTSGDFKFADDLSPHVSSAHPIFDPFIKEWVGLCIEYGYNSKYILYSMSEHSDVRKPIASITVGYPAYMHSFALTKNFIILTEQPFLVRPYDLLVSNNSFIDTFTWQPQQGTNFIVIDRQTGKKIGIYKTDPFFTLHNINSYERNRTIVVDLIAYKNPDIITKAFTYKNLISATPNLPASRLMRFTINLNNNSVSKRTIFKQAVELPSFNESKRFAEYQFIYAASSKAGFANQLIKFDLFNNQHTLWKCDNCYVTQPVFIPNPDGLIEDDGVILCVILDSKEQKSFLLFLDAKNMQEIARAYVPHHIPFTIHSNFFPI